MPLTNKPILVVDDEPVIRTALAKLFTNAGYQVQTAESAEQALQLMRASPAAVLFLDLNLPAMNGVDLCREVHKEWPWSITIAVTGYASLFELVKCREAGFEDYFIKPVSSKDLLAVADCAFRKLERWKQRPDMQRPEIVLKAPSNTASLPPRKRKKSGS